MNDNKVEPIVYNGWTTTSLLCNRVTLFVSLYTCVLFKEMKGNLALIFTMTIGPQAHKHVPQTQPFIRLLPLPT